MSHVDQVLFEALTTGTPKSFWQVIDHKHQRDQALFEEAKEEKGNGAASGDGDKDEQVPSAEIVTH